MRGHRDLRAAAAGAILCAALAIALPLPELRLLFAAPLALFLPGYAIVSATFVRHPLEPATKGLLSVGMSLAVLALGAFPLDLAPGGISTPGWAILLAAVVLGGCAVAARRRPPASGEARAVAWPQVAPAETGLLALGGAAAAVAMVLAFVPLSAQDAEGFTELWMLPDDEPGVAARVGVANREQVSSDYLLEVRYRGRSKPFFVETLGLDPGEEEVVAVPPPPAEGKRPVKLTATLFRIGITNPYRRVSTWVIPREE